MIVQQTCSVSRHTALDDLFHTDQDDLTWPTFHPRKLKGRCRGGCLIYPGRKPGRIPVDCGKCAVFDLDLSALYFNSGHMGGSWCRGLVPELLQSKQDCIFQNKCNLDYHNSVIAWVPPSSFDCLGKWPMRIQVQTSCLNTERNPITDVIKSEQHSGAREGLIRSHFYDRRFRTTHPSGDKLYSSENSLELSPPEDPNEETFLLLHFHVFHLTNGAKLQVLGSALDCQTTWIQGHTYVIPSGNLHKVSLVFSLGQTGQTGEGFDICFRWFKAANSSSVLRDFETTIAKCDQHRNLMRHKPHLPVYDVIQYAESQHMTGVVRSHPNFPWNYARPRRAFQAGSPESTRCCSPRSRSRAPRGRACRRPCKTVTHTLRAPLGQNTVRLTADRLALARGDRLEIVGRNRSVYRVAQGKTYDFHSDFVELRFTIRLSRLHTGQGFRLCYMWYSPGGTNPVDADVCSSFALKLECPKKSRRRKRSKGRGHGLRSKLPRECRI